MIEKSEITTMATKLGLNVETVQKDYVLSWVLWGINTDVELRDKWLFKGGTSLKKCFFDTFRFSEDLDFTVTDSAHLTEVFLKQKFFEITDNVYNEAGIEFLKDKFKFEILPKANGKLSAQGQIHYNSLLKKIPGSNPRVASIKLDLTNDEIIALNPQKMRVDHPYTDEPTNGIWATCYAFEEVIAEKIRALSERARPRDLYDVIHFFRNRDMIKNPQLVYSVLAKKCSYKNIPFPTYTLIEAHEKIEELGAQWHNMLAHQLPSLPPLESFWADLEPFFEWLEGHLQEQPLESSSEMDGKTFQPDKLSSAFSVDSVIRKIQFAAANRVCIDLTYKDKNRTIEPLSFRTTSKGKRVLYGFELQSMKIKAFELTKIQKITITNNPYQERKYPIEISASGQVVMPPVRRKV